MPRNAYPGTCYKCQAEVPAGGGFFQRNVDRLPGYGGWLVQCAGCSVKGGSRKLASGRSSLDRSRDPQPGQWVGWTYMPAGGVHSLQRLELTGQFIGVVKAHKHITQRLSPDDIARLALDFRSRVDYERAIVEAPDGRLHLIARGKLFTVPKPDRVLT